MEGGMGPFGPFANPLVAVVVLLILPGLCALAVYRGERARRDREDVLTSSRTRRTYFCFVAWGVFVLLGATVALVSEPYLEVVGILGAIPIGIVTAVGLFHALMVWRVGTIQILLLATIVLGALVAGVSLPDMWVAVIGALYGFGVIVIASQGLHRLNRVLLS